MKYAGQYLKLHYSNSSRQINSLSSDTRKVVTENLTVADSEALQMFSPESYKSKSPIMMLFAVL